MAPFPGYAEELTAAANVFDRVRYLGGTGTREEWLAIRELERELGATRPILRADAIEAVPS